MNERTNQEIEKYLKNNRYIRYDEIDKIMTAVDKVTDFPEEKGKPQQQEPPLRALFMKSFEMPVWLTTALCIIMFVLGRYAKWQ